MNSNVCMYVCEIGPRIKMLKDVKRREYKKKLIFHIRKIIMQIYLDMNILFVCLLKTSIIIKQGELYLKAVWQTFHANKRTHSLMANINKTKFYQYEHKLVAVPFSIYYLNLLIALFFS